MSYVFILERMGEDFSRYRIKDYKHWSLFLQVYQYPYLGRCYAWARNPAAANVDCQTKDMRDEAFDVVYPAWKKAVTGLWQPDYTNVASFGNEYPHLHWHFIPRYHDVRRFYDMLFVNPNPKGNYSPYPRVRLPDSILMPIREEIAAKL